MEKDCTECPFGKIKGCLKHMEWGENSTREPTIEDAQRMIKLINEEKRIERQLDGWWFRVTHSDNDIIALRLKCVSVRLEYLKITGMQHRA